MKYVIRGYNGIRPIVCLKSDVELKKLDDGTYQIVKKPKSATDVASAPWAYYGAEITNYEAPHAGVDKWRIYYADEENIYLIADDYIAGENAPDGQNGSSIYENDTYKLSFNDVINDYSGAEWIVENSKGSKWLTQYLSKNSTSTNINIKAVAYMMDTNVWSKYYAGADAEYSMGGPTIEMFCESYKDTHPSKYLECKEVYSYGYQVRWNGDSWDYGADGIETDFNEIYIKTDTVKSESMWIASPSGYRDEVLMYIYYDYDGIMDEVYYDYRFPGLRPIVCLKSEIQIINSNNGKFEIVK